MDERRYDIVLLGATGFTGSLISEYLLLNTNAEGRSFALAGRNEEKGRQLIRSLEVKHPGQKKISWLTVDVNDSNSLKLLTTSTRVVMNAAGPFAEYAPPVVEACIENGCHYLDITGEPWFYHDMINKWHEKAVQEDICIVPACGFDSIPADFGAWLAAQNIKSKDEVTVRAYLKTNAQFSGGTWTTAIKGISRNRQKALKPQGVRKVLSRKIPLKIHFDKNLGRWALPMPILDPHVVKRSSRLDPEAYGNSFAYGQFLTLRNWWSVFKLVMSVMILFLLVRIPWGKRWLLKQNLPGTGPDERRRERSGFEFLFIGTGNGQRSKAKVKGGDPGYNETSKMFSQSAFCLLDRLDNASLVPGLQTPVTGLGKPLMQRLRQRGMTFELVDGN